MQSERCRGRKKEEEAQRRWKRKCGAKTVKGRRESEQQVEGKRKSRMTEEEDGILFLSSISNDDWPATTRGVWQQVGKNFIRSAVCFCQHGGVKERLKTDGEPVVNVQHCFCAAPEKEAFGGIAPLPPLSLDWD